MISQADEKRDSIVKISSTKGKKIAVDQGGYESSESEGTKALNT